MSRIMDTKLDCQYNIDYTSGICTNQMPECVGHIQEITGGEWMEKSCSLDKVVTLKGVRLGTLKYPNSKEKVQLILPYRKQKVEIEFAMYSGESCKRYWRKEDADLFTLIRRSKNKICFYENTWMLIIQLYGTANSSCDTNYDDPRDLAIGAIRKTDNSIIVYIRADKISNNEKSPERTIRLNNIIKNSKIIWKNKKYEPKVTLRNNRNEVVLTHDENPINVNDNKKNAKVPIHNINIYENVSVTTHENVSDPIIHENHAQHQITIEPKKDEEEQKTQPKVKSRKRKRQEMMGFEIIPFQSKRCRCHSFLLPLEGKRILACEHQEDCQDYEPQNNGQDQDIEENINEEKIFPDADPF